MAIFGDLRSMNLLDIVPLLMHLNGKLILTREKSSLHLVIRGRRIICAREDHRILSESQLEELLFDFLDEKQGEFTFHKSENPSFLRNGINLPLDELILKLITLRDELDNVRAELPLPDTVFALANVAVAYSEPDLAEFLDRAWPHLTEGASARSLARALGLPLERVRYLLYKLRTLGAIQPKAQKAETNGERRGLAGRLLGMLKKRFRNLSWSL